MEEVEQARDNKKDFVNTVNLIKSELYKNLQRKLQSVYIYYKI